MYRIFHTGIIVILFSGVTNAHASFFDTDLVSKLYSQSGLSYQISQLPHLISHELTASFQFDQRLKNISTNQSHAILHAIEVTFNPDILRTRVKSTLEALLRKDDIEPILAWLNSPDGKRITELEKAATFQDLKMEMVVFKQHAEWDGWAL